MEHETGGESEEDKHDEKNNLLKRKERSHLKVRRSYFMRCL
jgi:hypothetical protein